MFLVDRIRDRCLHPPGFGRLTLLGVGYNAPGGGAPSFLLLANGTDRILLANGTDRILLAA